MHQTHHRGQMTVLMRQAGLRIPVTLRSDLRFLESIEGMDPLV
ncbi:DinB family protein [Paenibacillus vortex]|nr:DinB family protein [Paenibacillus vortex]